MRTLFRCALALAVSLTALGPWSLLAADKPPIKVGAILPMSGFLATSGTIYKASIDLAVEDINAAGGVNGSKIELVVADDKLNPSESVLLFRQLAGQDVVAVLGPISSSSWENVAPLAGRLRFPTLNFTTFKEEVANNDYTIRIHPHEGTMIPEAVGEFLKLYPNVKRVVLSGDIQQASGVHAIEKFKLAAEKHGLEVLEVIPFQRTTTDFSPIVIKVRGLQPDALFTAAVVPTMLRLVKEFQVQGLEAPVLNNGMLWPGGFPQAAGKAGAKVYTIGFSTIEPTPDNPRHRAFIERVTQRLASDSTVPQPPNPANGILGYEGMKLLAELMVKNGIDGNTEIAAARKRIRDAFEELKVWESIYRIELDKNRNAYLPAHLLKLDVEGKRWVYALPSAAR